MNLRLAILIGSVRKGRVAPTVAKWFAAEASRVDRVEVDLIDLADVPLPAALGDPAGPEVLDFASRLARADAFVVVTPEYNHSFPAALKHAIDWNYEPWRAKPVGFVSYGGRSGGLRAVEQLRQVYAEMHAVTVRDTVSFHDVWSSFDSAGKPTDPDSCAKAAAAMLKQLAWWGTALRDARLCKPYSV